MASSNGAAEAQQTAATEDKPADAPPAGGLSTIEEEPEDDGDMVGPVVPRSRKRRVILLMHQDSQWYRANKRYLSLS